MSCPGLAMSELNRRERRYLAKEHPEITRHSTAVIGAADDADLLAQAIEIVATLQRRGEQLDRTIDAMLPSAVPGKAAVLQARRNAEARSALCEEFGALSSSEVADLAGSKATNRAALANRWRKERRIFAVNHRGRALFVSFQFGPDGKPLPVIGEVLRTFGERNGGWQTALWFTATNGWLGGGRPVDLLASAPEKVAEAARREATEFVF